MKLQEMVQKFIQETKRNFAMKFANRVCYVFFGIFLAALLEFGIRRVIILGLILSFIFIIVTHWNIIFED